MPVPELIYLVKLHQDDTHITVSRNYVSNTSTRVRLVAHLLAQFPEVDIDVCYQRVHISETACANNIRFLPNYYAAQIKSIPNIPRTGWQPIATDNNGAYLFHPEVGVYYMNHQPYALLTTKGVVSEMPLLFVKAEDSPERELWHAEGVAEYENSIDREGCILLSQLNEEHRHNVLNLQNHGPVVYLGNRMGLYHFLDVQRGLVVSINIVNNVTWGHEAHELQANVTAEPTCLAKVWLADESPSLAMNMDLNKLQQLLDGLEEVFAELFQVRKMSSVILNVSPSAVRGANTIITIKPIRSKVQIRVQDRTNPETARFTVTVDSLAAAAGWLREQSCFNALLQGTRVPFASDLTIIWR